MVANSIYIQTEGVGKILTNILKLITVNYIVQTKDVLGFKDNNLSYVIQRYLCNDWAYDKLSGKEDW
jgi:hypothetical protein